MTITVAKSSGKKKHKDRNQNQQNNSCSSNKSQPFQKQLVNIPPGCSIHLLNPWLPSFTGPILPQYPPQLGCGVHRLGRQPREGPQLPGPPQSQLLLQLLTKLETLSLKHLRKGGGTELQFFCPIGCAKRKYQDSMFKFFCLRRKDPQNLYNMCKYKNRMEDAVVFCYDASSLKASRNRSRCEALEDTLRKACLTWSLRFQEILRHIISAMCSYLASQPPCREKIKPQVFKSTKISQKMLQYTPGVGVSQNSSTSPPLVWRGTAPPPAGVPSR